MNEYIDKKQAIDRIASCYCMDCEHSNGILCRACEHQDDMDLIDDMPAADVQPVKRGKWMCDTLGRTCSECNTYISNKVVLINNRDLSYCPICGANMREVDDKNEAYGK